MWSCGNYFLGETLHHMGKFCEDVVQVEFRNWLQDVTCLQMFKRCLICWDFSPYCGGGGARLATDIS